MASERTDREKRPADKELEFGTQLYETFLDSLAELLALRVTSKEVGRDLMDTLQEKPGAGPSATVAFRGTEIRELAFDLARLQVQNLRELTKVGRNHTDFLRRRLEERRGAAKRHREDLRRREVLVELSRAGDEYVGEVSIVNATSSRELVIFPQVLTFRSSDGKESFFVAATFEPADLVLSSGQTEKLRMSVRRDQFRQPQVRYLAQAAISLGRERSLELFVQLVTTEEKDG